MTMWIRRSEITRRESERLAALNDLRHANEECQRLNAMLDATARAPVPPTYDGRCPNCNSGPGEFTVAFLTFGFSTEKTTDPRINPAGAGLCCQRCGAIFCVGPNGSFPRSPRAIPPMIEMPQMPPTGADNPTHPHPPGAQTDTPPPFLPRGLRRP
jgi:hypothetical protein